MMGAIYITGRHLQPARKLTADTAQSDRISGNFACCEKPMTHSKEVC